MSQLKEMTVHDVDECLVNSVEQHVVKTPLIAKAMGLDWPENELPTYAEVCGLGGTHKAYDKFPEYRAINELLRTSAHFNTHLNEIPGAKDALLALQEMEMFGFYLTTRPESMAHVTLEQLVSLGFPKAEVIARPDSVPLEKTSEWKLQVLKERQRGIKSPKLMIDDSLGMRTAIVDAKHGFIKGILHDGPITPKGNGEMNWTEIMDMLTSISTWDILTKELSARSK